MSNSADFFLLTTLGAGCFALSFIRGREGQLTKSILLGAGAALAGLCNVVNGGALLRDGPEALISVWVAINLPVLGVAISRELYRRAGKNT